MTTADLEQVVSLAKAVDLNGWDESDFENELVNSVSLLFVAVSDGKITGYVFVRLITPIVEIISIAVLPEERRRGIGKGLLQKVIQKTAEAEFTECWLEVREPNLSAINFYLSMGFEIVGRRRNYYSNPLADAILMTLVYSKDNPKN